MAIFRVTGYGRLGGVEAIRGPVSIIALRHGVVGGITITVIRWRVIVKH